MIFIVDDDLAVRDSLRLLLESEGLAAEDFASGGAFLAARVPTDGDCLILDADMPGLSGLDLLERLRARGLHLPVIMVMARASLSTRRRAAACGVRAMLTKPFDSDAIIEAVRAALDAASAA